MSIINKENAIGMLKNKKEIEKFLKELHCHKDKFFLEMFNEDIIVFKNYDLGNILLERYTYCPGGALCWKIFFSYLNLPEL